MLFSHNMVPGSFKTVVKNFDHKFGAILRSFYKLLDESPARLVLYEMLTKSNILSLLHCGHMWFENENCTKHAEMIWPGYAELFLMKVTSSNGI